MLVIDAFNNDIVCADLIHRRDDLSVLQDLPERLDAEIRHSDALHLSCICPGSSKVTIAH